MQIELPLRSAQCAKHGCMSRYTHRHHMGCEKLWVRHFKHKRRTNKYKVYRERYYEYRLEDTVELCKEHHQQIHQIYYPIIGRWAWRHGALRTWNWRLAERLRRHLQKQCRLWLAKP